MEPETTYQHQSSSDDELVSTTTPPMRPLNLSNVARGRPSLLGNVSPRYRSNAVQIRLPIASTRQQRHSTQRVMASPWAQHPLKPSTPNKDDLARLSNRLKVAPGKHTAYVALGSNLGDRIGMIEKACNEMAARGITIKRTSCLWETEPMYVLDQENFINGACEVRITRSLNLVTHTPTPPELHSIQLSISLPKFGYVQD